MVDHHTLLFVLGVALGTSLHAAVTHYKVPVLMAARAAVATAKKAAVEAFEDVSDDEIPEENPADAGSQDATGPECRDEQIPLQVCPLAIVSQSPSNQLMAIQPSAPQLPIVQPTVLRRIQHWVAAGPPALQLEGGLAAWHISGHVPVLGRHPRQSAGHSSNARRGAPWASGKLRSGVTAFKLRCSWAHARVSTAAFVAAAAVIGVSCVWWAWDREPAQQQNSNSKNTSGISSRLLDTPAVLNMVLNSRQSPSSKRTASVAPEHRYAFYLSHAAASLSLSSGSLQQPPMPQAEHAHSSSTSHDSSGLTNTAATHQQKMFEQQHLGVSLHQQTRLDRDLSMLERALQATRPGHSSSDSRARLAAWFHLMDEYLSEEVRLAEALVGQ